MAINHEFWKGKRVLLTGHTGFKGGWLSLWLQTLGVNLHGLSLDPPTQPNLYTFAKIAHDMSSTIGDIRNFDLVNQVFKKFRPEIVIHMAAQPLVLHSYREPLETYSTNLMGTVHILESVRLSNSVRILVNVTTDKCYENREWVWGYREDEPMGGADPYSNSKGCAELATSAYRQSFFSKAGIGIASVRAGNVIGGGDWALNRLIPDILRSFEQKKPVIIRNPNSIRPWQHVLEPLSGYLRLAELLWEDPLRYSGGWNFGPHDDDAKTVLSIVEYMVKKWGNGAEWIQESSSLHEASYLKLDISKSRNYIGWNPRWSLEKALDSTIDWYKSYIEKGNLRLKTVSQIEEFLKKD